MEQILDFKSETLGVFTLSDFNDRHLHGSVYINFEKDWTQISDGYFRINRYDSKKKDIIKKITEILSQNLHKSNYLILKLSNNENSMVSFFVNRNAVIFDEDNEIYQILVTKLDFIGSSGMPNIQSEYTLAFILNDPSKERNITKTNTSKIPAVNTAQFTQDLKPTKEKPKLLPPKKYYPDSSIPVNVADYIKEGPKIYENEAYKNWNEAKLEEVKEKAVPKKCGIKRSIIITSIFVILVFYLLKK
jgi:hypothetical protein